MPILRVPNSVSLHTLHKFLEVNNAFAADNNDARLVLNPSWMHLDPIALCMIAAWGSWCIKQGLDIKAENLGRKADYAARMHLFQHLGVDYQPNLKEREESGRFLPLTRVTTSKDISNCIANISALLHLDKDPDTLAAVQYCMSELLRNSLEHSGAENGAFVCAHYFRGKGPHRVSIAVADTGCGIRAHLGRAHKEANESDMKALQLAMTPGITGALPGPYGAPDNAGAGLFITRSIAKATRGYFCILSGNAGFRLRRARNDVEQLLLFQDAMLERSDQWSLPNAWKGTAVSVEIRPDMVDDFQGIFQWVRKQVPTRVKTKKRIRFT